MVIIDFYDIIDYGHSIDSLRKPKMQINDLSKKVSKYEPALYLVATPIGNLGDITYRAIEILKECDVLLAEDTRIGGKLLSQFGIKQKIIRADEEVAMNAAHKALEYIQAGKMVALISDAGTPSVSDPGQRIAEYIIENSHEVFAIPGASAVLTALVSSGFDVRQFTFMGFAPTKSGQRHKFFEEFKPLKTAISYFETGPRLLECLKDLRDVLGERKIAVTRELTKLYEEKRRGNISDLIDHYEENGAPKGEIVIVIARDETEVSFDDDAINEMIKERINNMPLKAISKEIAEITGRKSRDIYELGLKLK